VINLLINVVVLALDEPCVFRGPAGNMVQSQFGSEKCDERCYHPSHIGFSPHVTDSALIQSKQTMFGTTPTTAALVR
jgi:hypothetical protein